MRVIFEVWACISSSSAATCSAWACKLASSTLALHARWPAWCNPANVPTALACICPWSVWWCFHRPRCFSITPVKSVSKLALLGQQLQAQAEFQLWSLSVCTACMWRLVCASCSSPCMLRQQCMGGSPGRQACFALQHSLFCHCKLPSGLW